MEAAEEEALASILEIDGVRPTYVAETWAWAGRFDEARQVLGYPILADSVVSKEHAYALLAYMAVREGDADEAMRLAELAVTGAADFGIPRSPSGVMSQVEVAAHLGDNAGAVRFLQEAYELGLPHGAYIFTLWDLRPLQGFKPFEDFMRPRG